MRRAAGSRAARNRQEGTLQEYAGSNAHNRHHDHERRRQDDDQKGDDHFLVEALLEPYPGPSGLVANEPLQVVVTGFAGKWIPTHAVELCLGVWAHGRVVGSPAATQCAGGAELDLAMRWGERTFAGWQTPFELQLPPAPRYAIAVWSTVYGIMTHRSTCTPAGGAFTVHNAAPN